MVVIRFSVLFDKVRRREKRQTIRPFENYRRLKVGDKVHCYSTKKVSYSKRPILDELLHVGICTEILVKPWGEIKNDDEVARLDGFRDAEDMKKWFKGRYGDVPDDRLFRIIRWD